MLLKGGGATPEFVFSADAAFLSPGLGRFTCCSRKHVDRNGAFMKCDKLKIGLVLDVMLTAKIDQLFLAENWMAGRYFICFTHWMRRGLDAPSMVFKRNMGTRDSFIGNVEAFRKSVDGGETADGGGESKDKGVGDGDGKGKGGESIPEASSSPAHSNVLQNWGSAAPFLETLHWRFGDRGAEDDFARSTGTSPIFWATLANEHAALLAIIDGIRKQDGEAALVEMVNRAITSPYPQFSMAIFTTPLHMAMAWCSWNVVSTLLDVGAEPKALCGSPRRYISPAHTASMFGRSDNVTRWASKFGDAATNRPDPFLGSSTLTWGLKFGGGQSLSVFRAGLRCGADAARPTFWGATALHVACSNPDTNGALVRAMLARPEVFRQLERGQRPTTLKWKTVFRAARLAVRFGSKKAMLMNFASSMGQTPLHCAARWANYEACEALVQAGANVNAKDGNGLTPLQLVESVFSGTPPDMLSIILGGQAKRRIKRQMSRFASTRRMSRFASTRRSEEHALEQAMSWAGGDGGEGEGESKGGGTKTSQGSQGQGGENASPRRHARSMPSHDDIATSPMSPPGRVNSGFMVDDGGHNKGYRKRLEDGDE
jgi:ankyrin repeat protein